MFLFFTKKIATAINLNAFVCVDSAQNKFEIVKCSIFNIKMNLTPEQIEKVKSWLAEGDKLSQVQGKISSEFGINLTYMEVRFLIDDIGAEIVDNSPPPETKNAEEKTGEEVQPSSNENPASPNQEQAPLEGGEVQVELSAIQRPGAFASGSVVFSDGVKAEWILDQSGRLSLVPSDPSYSPPQSDLPSFQKKLQELLMGS